MAFSRERLRFSVSCVSVRMRVVRSSRVGREEVGLFVGERVEERVLICVESWARVGRMEDIGDVGRVLDSPRAVSREVSRSAKLDMAAMLDAVVSGGSVLASDG